MFRVFIREQAAKRLAEMNEPYFSAIKTAVEGLEKNYFPAGKNCKRLKGEKNLYRIRIGTYRAIYHADLSKKIITILRIFHRGEGY